MKTCIKVLPSNAYDTPEKRKALAVMVATIVNVGLTENVPYLPTPGNDFKWAVDTGNDWLLEFDINDFRIFSLTHRYGNDKITTAIMDFIAYRLHAYVFTIVKKSTLVKKYTASEIYERVNQLLIDARNIGINLNITTTLKEE